MVEADSTLLLTLLREIRTELRDLRAVTLGNTEATRRTERRVGELRDELELMLKVEALGRSAHFETLYDEKLAKLEERIAAVEAGRPS